MKKLIFIAVAFVSLQVMAQHRPTEDKKNEAFEMQQISPEDQAKISTKKLTLLLDLNEKQQSEIKVLMLEQASQRKEMMAKRKANKGLNDEKGASKTSKVERINKRLDHQIEMKKKMKSVLTEEQYIKWDEMQMRRHDKMIKERRK